MKTRRPTPSIAGLTHYWKGYDSGYQDAINPIEPREHLDGKRPEYQIGYYKGIQEGLKLKTNN